MQDRSFEGLWNQQPIMNSEVGERVGHNTGRGCNGLRQGLRRTQAVGRNDVLCGRGSIINKHSGNLYFRRLISANKATYDDCSKNSHKQLLALSVVAAIQRQGGRFLRRENELEGEWVPISRKEAVSKAAQALRDQLQTSRRDRKSASPEAKKIKTNPKINVTGLLVDPTESGMVIPDSSRSDNGSHKPLSSRIHKLEEPTMMPPPSQSWVPGTSNASTTLENDVPPRRKMTSLLPHHTGMLTSRPTFFYSSDEPFFQSRMHHGMHSTMQMYQTPRYPLLTASSLGSGHIWVPAELESLMLSEPEAVRRIATL